MGAALVWQYFEDNADNDNTPDDDEIANDLEKAKLKGVKWEEHGTGGRTFIDTGYFLQLLQYIGVSVRNQQKGYREEQIRKRRQALKDGKEADYRAIVKNMLEHEERAVHEFLRKVLVVLEIDQQAFELTHNKLANHPQTAEYVMAAQQGKLTQPEAPVTPKISKMKTMQYLKKSQEQAMEKMDEMSKQQQ